MVSKPPAFDNPLRRTTSLGDEKPATAETTAEVAPTNAAVSPIVDTDETIDAVDAVEGGSEQRGVVLSFAGSMRPDDRVDPTTTRVESPAGEINHRITVRIDDATRCALEAECHRRRIAGQKTNVAEIARSILAQWTRRRGNGSGSAK